MKQELSDRRKDLKIYSITLANSVDPDQALQDEWVCGKQCRSDASERSIWSGLHCLIDWLRWGFNNTSTLVGHFVSSPTEREKRDRRDSRDEREGQGRKMNRNESDKTFLLYPYLLQR